MIVSVVIPCLNEAETIAECVTRARAVLDANASSGEVIVVDNGSDDGSGEPHFDLAGYVADRLARAGVGTVSDLGLCTYCDETRLFSYRRSQHHGEQDYGRQISAIVLA